MEDDTMMVIVMQNARKFYNPKSTFLKWYNVKINGSFALIRIDDIYDVVEYRKEGGVKIPILQKKTIYLNLSNINYVYEYESVYELFEE